MPDELEDLRCQLRDALSSAAQEGRLEAAIDASRPQALPLAVIVFIALRKNCKQFAHTRGEHPQKP